MVCEPAEVGPSGVSAAPVWPVVLCAGRVLDTGVLWMQVLDPGRDPSGPCVSFVTVHVVVVAARLAVHVSVIC